MTIETALVEVEAQEDFMDGAAPDENPYPPETDEYRSWKRKIDNLYYCEWLEQQRKNAQGLG